MQLIRTCTLLVVKDTTLSFTGLLSLLLLVEAAPSDRQSSNSPSPSPEDMNPAGQLSCSLPRQSGRAPARGRLVGLLTSPVAPHPAGGEHGWRPARQGPGGCFPPRLIPCTRAAPKHQLRCLPQHTAALLPPFFRSHWSSISSSSAVSHNTFPPPQ